MKRTAARLLVDTLVAHDVDLMYCVPGESYLAITDALMEAPSIRLIVCRHEGGAGFMALADGKITGKPGVLMVSRGPGATNASIAIHTAKQDATPLVALIGQAERHDLGKGALQEVDYSKTFSDMAKLVIDVRDGKLISEAVARAMQVARTGTPGAVVVVLPEDMLEDLTDAPVCGPRPFPRSRPLGEDIERVAEMLRKAEKPLVLVGGTLHGAEASAAMVQLAEKWTLPVMAVHRRYHTFPNKHPNYAGVFAGRPPAKQFAAIRETDLIVSIGARLGDTMTQGYTFPKAPVPDQPFIHVYPDPEQIGRVWAPTVGISCDPHAFVEALLAETPGASPDRRNWVQRLASLEREVKEFHPQHSNEGVVFGAVVTEIRKHLKPDAVIAGDAGNFASWVARYLQFDPQGIFLGALSGAMGGGVPGAVAGGLRLPGRQHLGFVGDGGFLMTGNELATAMQYDVPVKIFISNNNAWGTIRMHQELRYPGRVTNTTLRNPDFAKLAEAFGAKGLRIQNEADIAPVVAEAMAHDGAVVVEVATSLYHLSAMKTMDDLAKDAAARQAAKEKQPA